MSQTINVNGVSINYPETGDTNWSDEATNFAVQTSSALGKIGLSSGTSVDVVGTLDVTLATTLDSTLTVAGTTTLNGTANLNGNINLGNATSDTIAVTGILNVDSGVLYVDPTNNRVGINKTNPAQALDVVGNSAISGNETIGGTLNVTGAATLSSTLGVTGNVTLTANLNVNGNTTIGNASGDTTTINGTAVSVPNGLNIDSDTFVIDAANNRVGIGTSSPINGLDVNDNARVGTTGDFTGLKIISKSDSSSVAKTSFLDSSNNLGIADSHIFFVHNPDGSSTISLATTPSGSRSSDRRVTRFNVAGDGQLSAVVPSGSTLYPGYLCRAWVNFNGTTASPSTIRGSGNVSSVTKNGTGDYTINFLNAMPDANYAISGFADRGSGTGSFTLFMGTNNATYSNTFTASSARITTRRGSDDLILDSLIVCLAVFR